MLLRQIWENRFRCSWTRNLCIYRTREIMHVAPTNVGKQVTLLLYTQFTY